LIKVLETKIFFISMLKTFILLSVTLGIPFVLIMFLYGSTFFKKNINND